MIVYHLISPDAFRLKGVSTAATVFDSEDSHSRGFVIRLFVS